MPAAIRGPASGDFIALYGSLRRGEPAYRQLGLDRLLSWIGPCLIPGRLHDFGDYPGLVKTEGGEVRGDLFAIRSPDAIRVMDAFEGFRPRDPALSLYLRARVDLIRPQGGCWVYVYNTDHDAHDHRTAPVVVEGDWLAHMATRTADGKDSG